MIAIYVLLGILIALVIALGIFVGVVFSKKKSGGGVSIEDVQAENEKLAQKLESSIEKSKFESSMTTGALNAQVAALKGEVTSQNDNAKSLTLLVQNFATQTDQKLESMRKDVADKVDEVRKTTQQAVNQVKDDVVRSVIEVKNSTAQSIKEVREDNAKNLAEVKRDNQEQLEKVRKTVDEQLSTTLETRFSQSFKIVNDRLEEINRTFTELQTLQTGVADLNKIFKNVKTRGTWGEIALESLLSQILVPEQYDKQVKLTRGSDDMVDFVIKMPGKGDGEVLLPIDSKFPIEDYEKIADAAESGNADEVKNAIKGLALRIKGEAKSIRDKYIKPPKTTDFAIMYLPTEGLYAEVIRIDGLVEDLQSTHRVVVCGPTTIAALLNSLQMGFKSVAIEKRSTQIAKLLQDFMGDFAKFRKLLVQTTDKIDKVKSTLQEAEHRTEIIGKKLDKVSRITGDDAPSMAMLEEQIAGDVIEFDEDETDEG